MLVLTLDPARAARSSSPGIPQAMRRSPAFQYLRDRDAVRAVFDALDRFL